MKYYLTLFSVMFLAGGLFVHTTSALVATSTNYRIDRDSINFAGNLSESASYSLEDTAGEVGSGISSSTNYLLNAGYQQNDGYIAISAPPDVDLLPGIDGKVGGNAVGNAVWKVTTDNAAGYSLSLKASTGPALVSGGNSFANYTKAGANPDFTWTVASTDSEFGFSPEGTAITSTYKDNGSACGVGALDATDSCWDSITTSNKQVAGEVTANHPAGTNTTIKFRAEAGSSANQAAGSYLAVITATALAI